MLKRKPIRVGIAIIILGALFKILHWPGANLIFMIGCIATIFTQLGIFILTRPKRPRDYIVSTFIIPFITYYMMKVLHWPGSSIPLTIATITLIAALSYQLITPEVDVLQLKKDNKNARIVYLTSIVLVIFGAMLKIMHWPMANPLLIAGLGLLAFYFIIDAFRR